MNVGLLARNEDSLEGAYHRWREVYAGTPVVVKTVLGNKLAPRLTELYLDRNGYDGQQTDERVDTDRPDYLFEPDPGDHGAHGPFDKQSRERDLQFWATKNLFPLALAGAAGLASRVLRRAGEGLVRPKKPGRQPREGSCLFPLPALSSPPWTG